MPRDYLTKKQLELVEWALGPMADFWCTEEGAYERDGEVYQESDLPRIQFGQLFLSTVEEINEDLLYRLEEQLPDMASQDVGNATPGDAKRAKDAARIIRKQM